MYVKLSGLSPSIVSFKNEDSNLVFFIDLKFLTVVIIQSLSRVQLFVTLGLQHSRIHCPSRFPRVGPKSCPLSQWYYVTISSSVALISIFCFILSYHASHFSPVIMFLSSLHNGDKKRHISLNTSWLVRFSALGIFFLLVTVNTWWIHLTAKLLPISAFTTFYIFPLILKMLPHSNSQAAVFRMCFNFYAGFLISLFYSKCTLQSYHDFYHM